MSILKTSRSLLQSLSISERIRTSARPGVTSREAPACKGASLLGLPVELRIIILRLVLGDAHVKLRFAPRHRRRERRNAWGLLQICHQIRLEIRQTFFHAVTFTLPRDLTERKLGEWLAMIGSEAVSDLRKLHFDCESQCALRGLHSGLDYCLREATLNLSQAQSCSDDGDVSTPVHLIQACSNRSITCINRTKARWSAEDVASSWAPGALCPREKDILSIWRALNQNNSGRQGEWSRRASEHGQEGSR